MPKEEEESASFNFSTDNDDGGGTCGDGADSLDWSAFDGRL